MNDRLDLAEERDTINIMRDTFARLPDPEQYAYILPLDIAEALVSAWASPAGRRATLASAVKLRPYGLCDYASTHLTVFGTRVRSILMRDMLA